jgi:hypothetical protein
MKLEKKQEIGLPTGVLGMACHPAGPTLYAACMDGAIYAVTPGSDPLAFPGRHESYASGCVLTPDGKTLISAGYDGCLLWHDTATRQSFRRIKAHQFWSWQLALSPDGSLVASSTGQYLAGGEKYEPAPESEPSLRVYHSHSGDLAHSFSHQPPVLSTTFSPDGQFLAAANLLGEIRIWNLSQPQQPPVSIASKDFTSWGSIKSHHFCGGIYGLAFSPDGATLAGCGMGPMTDPMAGNGKMTWQRWAWQDSPPRLLGLMESLAWHPSGSHFVMAGRQAQGTWNAAVFDAAEGRLVSSLDTKNRITRAAFLPDGTLWLAACNGQPGPKDGRWPSFGRLIRCTLS